MSLIRGDAHGRIVPSPYTPTDYGSSRGPQERSVAYYQQYVPSGSCVARADSTALLLPLCTLGTSTKGVN
jgi:hypothetical protein